MKTCNACHITVNTTAEFCPLCGSALDDNTQKESVILNPYPNLSKTIQQYGFLRRLLLFISLFVVIGCVLINLLTPHEDLWSLLVAAGVAYFWLIVPPILRRGSNRARQIMSQVIFTSLLVLGIDFFFGYQGWSLDYVIPSLLMAGIVGIALMAIFNRTRWAQYVLYQLIVATFSFVPLVLYLVGLTDSMVMVLVTAILGLASLLATIIFADRSVKNEFKRRFHF